MSTMLATDGQSILFQSFATNLDPADRNQSGDLYLVRMEEGEGPLRFVTIERLGVGETTLTWAAREGRSYQVEYKDDLNETAWQPLNAQPSVTGQQAMVTDSKASNVARRFYRVSELR